MRFSIRPTLILMLILAMTAGALAQQAPAVSETALEPVAAQPSPEAVPAESGEVTAEPASTSPSIHEVRAEFNRLLRQHPRELARILTLDPTLLSNESYMAAYPELARFAAQHPEIQRHPRFYFAEFTERPVQSPLDEIFEGFLVLGVVALITFALFWLVRTVIEQKRWNRLSRSQNEVHNKILDRFSSSEELLSYIRTPAGTKFLESAPIALHASQTAAQSGPFNRILWSIQLGVIIAVAGLGMMMVGIIADGETARGFVAIGVIALALGAGFIASAAASMILSRRLGVWMGEEQPQPKTNPYEETGQVR
jgi:ABC-type multidrug transport system fused ATPase/permease subunit